MAITSSEAYEKIKDILGLPEGLIQCDIHLRTDDVLRISNCEFYASKETEEKTITIKIDGFAEKDFIKDCIEKAIKK